MISAIIPARGGSKGIPHKNLVDLCGKPLVVWSIEQALASQLVDEVIVSSDCSIIGSVAQDAGAIWHQRSKENASDTASTESVMLEVLDTLHDPGLLVLLQPTSPIRQPHDIDGAVRCFHGRAADSCFSARHVEGYTWTDGGKHPIPNYHKRERRQNHAARTLEENGSIYCTRPYILRRHGNRLAGKVVYYEMHPLDSFQIDTQSDLDMMQELLPLRLDPKLWTFSATSTACYAPTTMGITPEHYRTATTSTN